MKFVLAIIGIGAAGTLGYLMEPSLRPLLTKQKNAAPRTASSTSPTSDAEPEVPAPAPDYDYTKLLPEQLPAKITLKSEANATAAGETDSVPLPAGTKVKPLRIEGFAVVFSVLGTAQGKIDVKQTDLIEQLVANPPAPVVTETAPQPEPAPAVTTKPEPEPEPEPAPKPSAKPKPTPTPQPAQPAQIAEGSGNKGASGTNGTAQAATQSESETADLRAGWGADIRARIERRKSYPRDGDGAAGTVKLRLTVGTDGRLAAVQIVASSGSAALDAAAVKAVQRAGRFPKAPRGLEPGQVTFTLPVSFKP